MAAKHRTIIGLHLIITREDRVLLGKRMGTGWADGYWHLPAGHLERRESVVEGAGREAREELGICVGPDGLRLVHALHRFDRRGGDARLQLFFHVLDFTGKIRNAEPDKCTQLAFWPQDELPSPVVDDTVVALAAIRDGRSLSLLGWD